MKAFLEIDSYHGSKTFWYYLMIVSPDSSQTVSICTRDAFKALFKKHKKQLISKEHSFGVAINIRFEINLFS